jgi:hypothetical protein
MPGMFDWGAPLETLGQVCGVLAGRETGMMMNWVETGGWAFAAVAIGCGSLALRRIAKIRTDADEAIPNDNIAALWMIATDLSAPGASLLLGPSRCH